MFIATFGFEYWPPWRRYASFYQDISNLLQRECGQYCILEFNQVVSMSGVIIRGSVMVWGLGITPLT